MAINPRAAGLALGACLSIAAALAATFEGHRAQPYRDVTGIPTVCYGHTGKDIQDRKYTQAECDALLQADILRANQVVRSCITRPMPTNVEAALTVFTYNVGPGRVGVKDGLCWLKSGRQPQIRILANAGNWAGVCNQFQYWASAGGKRMRGLERRREAERNLCMKD